MQEGIHPKVKKVTFACACGNSFESESTINAKDGNVVKVDICNKCHPFFTGNVKIVDASGRVEKFNKKFESSGKKGNK